MAQILLEVEVQGLNQISAVERVLENKKGELINA
jgi:hypothetical protein